MMSESEIQAEHDDAYARCISEAKRLYGRMIRSELEKWQAILRDIHAKLPTHSSVAALEVIHELLQPKEPNESD